MQLRRHLQRREDRPAGAGDPRRLAKVARQLGLVHEGGLPLGLQVLGFDGDTVLPTVIVTDASGLILFLDATDNYRGRPEPATFLRVLDAASVPE